MIFVAIAAVSIMAVGIYVWRRSASAPSAYWPEEKAMSYVAPTNESGSGYRDLEGKTLSYNYVGFGSFQLAVFDNHLKWQGFGDFGYFVGITAQVDLQVSKIIEDEIYFLSWPTPSGGDNVVVNFKKGTVLAHLCTAGTDFCTFAQIHGSILKYPSKTPQGLFPYGPPTSMMTLFLKLNANTKKSNMPPIAEYDPPPVTEHEEAKKELSGKTIEYVADDGNIVSVAIKGDVTEVEIGGDNGSAKSYQTRVTKVDSGVYFVSWMADKISGKHIVVNTNSNQVFDHVMPDPTERKERIFELTRFQ